VAGYAAPGTDPTALVHPVRTAGSVSVTGTEPDSAQIAFSSSQVGGPAVDLTGQIRGVAVMAGAKTAVVGLEPLRAALAQAHLTAGTQAADALWRAAIADTSRSWYRRAVPVLRKLQASAPSYPYAADLLDLATQRIAAGKDRTPRAVPIWLIAVAALSAAGATAGVIVAARRRESTVAVPMPRLDLNPWAAPIH
jgi:hypothetical protein